MTVCPQCGFPVLEAENLIVSDQPIVCIKCKWSGSSRDLIVVPTHTDDEEFHKRIVDLYFWIAQNFGPRLAKKLYELRLVKQPKVRDTARMDKEDQAVLRFTALVLQAATRGAFRGIVEALTEEVAGGEQDRGTVH